MTALVWDKAGERFYETGIDHGVFYGTLAPPVAWNGITAVEETTDGGELVEYYIDGNKYANLVSGMNYQAKLSAFSAPLEFELYNGRAMLALGLQVTGQPRKTFGLSYRSRLGNDFSPDLGYKIHLVYNCMASSTDQENQTLGNSARPVVRQWVINTIPEIIPTKRPTAHLVIDSTKFAPAKIAALEDQLYGTVFRVSMPTPTEVAAILA